MSSINIPKVIAHRGDLSQSRENTLAAITDAIDAGIKFIECDIQLNADKVPVLLHDPSLKRLHGVNESIFESHYPLDSLAQLLDTLDQYPDVIAFLEVKFDSIDHWGMDTVLAELLPLLKGQKGLAGIRQKHVVITTFIPFLKEVRLRGHKNIGCILRDRRADTHAAITELAPDFLIINHRRIGRKPLWAGPWQWAAYEIGSVKQALRWAEVGIDYVISFNCGELYQALQAYEQ